MERKGWRGREGEGERVRGRRVREGEEGRRGNKGSKSN